MNGETWAWQDLLRIHARRRGNRPARRTHAVVLEPTPGALELARSVPAIAVRRVRPVSGGSALAVADTLIEVLVEDLDAALLVIAPDLDPSRAVLARRAMDLADARSAIVTAPGLVAAPGFRLLELYQRMMPRVLRLLLLFAHEGDDARDGDPTADLGIVSPIDLMADLIPAARSMGVIRLAGGAAAGTSLPLSLAG